MNTDHLARAREYIAKGDDFYAKAADEIIAAQKADPTLSNAEIGERIGRSKTWVGNLVRSRTIDPRADEPLTVDWQSGSNKRDEVAAKVMRDPEQRERVIAQLPQEDLEYLAQTAHNAAVARARAQRAEHQVETTAGEIMGDEKFDPAEYWADTLVIRVNRNARELAKLVATGGGLLFGTMSPEEAFDYLHEAERLIAETRAAAQEQVRDRTAV